MSHTPLKIFKRSHQRRMLISGQGPIREIAKSLGFTNTTTMDEFAQRFPALDTVDHNCPKVTVRMYYIFILDIYLYWTYIFILSKINVYILCIYLYWTKCIFAFLLNIKDVRKLKMEDFTRPIYG